MAIMKKTVYVYEKNKESLAFLRGFFSKSRNYQASFFTNLQKLKEQVKRVQPDIFIAGCPPCLKRTAAVAGSRPVMGILSGDLSGGFQSLEENAIEHYITPPYHEGDLAYKLQLVQRNFEDLDAMKRELGDLRAITELTSILSSTLDSRKVLYLIVKKLSELIPVTRCSMLSVPSAEHETFTVVSTFEHPDVFNLKLDINKYPEIRKALRTKKVVVVQDATHDPLMRAVLPSIASLGIHAIVVAPVIFRSEVIGTLFLRTSRRDYAFTEREIHLCQSVANVSANALNNAFLFERLNSEKVELQKLAITDFLTGVYNTRYLYHRLEDEFSRAARYNTALSCIMFDIDHFKRINDTYGHRAGDMVLREFADLVKTHIRKSDIFARYGGEEFILVLPHSHLEGAVTEGRRIRDILQAHCFQSISLDARITVSMGVAAFPHEGITSEHELINKADQALLKAKATGRARLVVAY
jgi:two-component system cell cycle response regulator